LRGDFYLPERLNCGSITSHLYKDGKFSQAIRLYALNRIALEEKSVCITRAQGYNIAFIKRCLGAGLFAALLLSALETVSAVCSNTLFPSLDDIVL
jgi:hypothetical protein